MGKIGPEGLPRRESGLPNKRLYPVGIDAIGKVLPTTITPEYHTELTNNEFGVVKTGNPELISFLKFYFDEYKRREVLGEESFFAFYNGAMMVHRLLRTQAADQIPVFSRNKNPEKDDVLKSLKTENAEIKSYANHFTLPISAFEEISYRRIKQLTALDDDGNDGEEAQLGNALLAQAHNYPGDGNAFLVGATALLFPVVTIWAEREQERINTEAQEQTRRRLKYWTKKDADDPENIARMFAQWTTETIEDIAETHPVWIR